MIKVVSAVIRKGDRVIAVTIQPDNEEGTGWMTAISGGSEEDAAWADEFFGHEDAEDVNTSDLGSIKSAIEKRIKKTNAVWDGWKHYHDYELPGSPTVN